MFASGLTELSTGPGNGYIPNPPTHPLVFQEESFQHHYHKECPCIPTLDIENNSEAVNCCVCGQAQQQSAWQKSPGSQQLLDEEVYKICIHSKFDGLLVACAHTL